MSDILAVFHHLRRKFEHAEQRLEQAGDRGDVRRIDDAIDAKKSVETQICSCLILVKRPDDMAVRA